MPFKFIKPKGISIDKMRKAIDQGLLATAAVVKVDMELATGTWEPETKPKWVEKLRTVQGTREWSYMTDSTPFVWVNNGTAGPYPIPKLPKMEGSLAFQEGFIPKTIPGRLMAGPGASFGKFVYAKQVMHPGIKARHITEDETERIKKDAAWRVQDAIKASFGQSQAAVVAAGTED